MPNDFPAPYVFKDCPECHGKGKFYDQFIDGTRSPICNVCSGTGKIKTEPDTIESLRTELIEKGKQIRQYRDAIIKIHECTDCAKARNITNNLLHDTITGKTKIDVKRE